MTNSSIVGLISLVLLLLLLEAFSSVKQDGKQLRRRRQHLRCSQCFQKTVPCTETSGKPNSSNDQDLKGIKRKRDKSSSPAFASGSVLERETDGRQLRSGRRERLNQSGYAESSINEWVKLGDEDKVKAQYSGEHPPLSSRMETLFVRVGCFNYTGNEAQHTTHMVKILLILHSTPNLLRSYNSTRKFIYRVAFSLKGWLACNIAMNPLYATVYILQKVLTFRI
ncbi:hypothetical protein KIN20_017542 [Parelaphostrongylus tenuis]|uniref:Uncharacterized protein n=1 Tax=Parelaphostrongylus tenuis TaxID=148309 RepID=A0AAD5N034_PARTN|nr:hypothetical protein KIN20_017542 [Parelaphostrongylus tenuis]